MSRILYIYILLLGAALPGYGQFSESFEVPSTLVTKFGDTLAERQAWFTGQVKAGDVALRADLESYNTILVPQYNLNLAQSYHSVYCVATNADPLITVSPRNEGVPAGVCGEFSCANGWNVLHIPPSCDPTPPANEGHAIVINTDQPEWLWDFYKLNNVSPGVYTYQHVRRWARTKAAGDSTSYPYDGDGRGTNFAYTAFTGATTACPAAAIRALGAVSRAQYDAGLIPHAIMMIVDGESNVPHAKLFPCRGNADNYQNGRTAPSRVNAPLMGERMMLDPNINCATINAGAAFKLLCVAMQDYGYVLADTGGEFEFSYEVEGPGTVWTGVDWTCSVVAACVDWLIQNSRWVEHPEAFEGEEAGLDPPPGFPDPVPVITTTTLDGGTLGLSYSETVVAVSGTTPYAWDITAGSLPTGLTLNASSGIISGIPSAAATYNFTIRVTDDNNLTDTQALSIVIPAGPDERPPVVPGAITLVSPLPAVWLRRPNTITFEWPWDNDFINSGTVTISGSCLDYSGPWDILATPAYNANVVAGVASVTIDPEALKIGACAQYKVQITAPRNGTNWGSEVTFSLGGQFIL